MDDLNAVTLELLRMFSIISAVKGFNIYPSVKTKALAMGINAPLIS